MVGRVRETARATQWACAVASTVAEDKISVLLTILKKNTDIRKHRQRKRV
jgi:hypothetical protein